MYHVLCTMHYVLCTLVVRNAAVDLTRTCRYRVLHPLAAVKPHPPSRSWQPGYLVQGAQRHSACPSLSYTLVCKAAYAGNAIFIYYFRWHHLSIVWISGGTHIIWGRTLAEFSETVTSRHHRTKQIRPSSAICWLFDKGL
jgi:hypothetical protein